MTDRDTEPDTKWRPPPNPTGHQPRAAIADLFTRLGRRPTDADLTIVEEIINAAESRTSRRQPTMTTTDHTQHDDQPTAAQRLADPLGWQHLPVLTDGQEQQLTAELNAAQAQARRIYGPSHPSMLPGVQDEHDGGAVDEHERCRLVFMLAALCY